MVREEQHNSRSQSWSRWHRQNLPNSCYMSDLDDVEWRPGRGIVAFLEIKHPGDNLTEWQEKRFLPDLAKLGKPVFVLVFPAELPAPFTVWRVHEDGRFEDLGIFTEDEFSAWMTKL